MSLRAVAEHGLSTALNVHFNELHGLKPLRWTLDTVAENDACLHLAGQASWGDYETDEGLELIEAWAAALGFERDWTSPNGTVYYRGTVDGEHVLLWVITDRAAFHGVSGK